MNNLNNWVEIFISNLKAFGNNILSYLPSILEVILIIVIGYFFARLIQYITLKFLKTIKFDDIAEKVQASKLLVNSNFKITASELVSKFVFWILLAFLFSVVADVLSWNSVSKELSKLISILPKIILSIFIFILGTYLSSLIRDVIRGTTSSLGIGSGKIFSALVFYFLILIVSLTALKQAGVDTSILSSNLSLIIGAFLVAMAISYGFASREVLSNILASYFNRSIYQIGMKIDIDGVVGVVDKLTSTSIFLREDNGDLIVIPMNTLLSTKVKIIK